MDYVVIIEKAADGSYSATCPTCPVAWRAVILAMQRGN